MQIHEITQARLTEGDAGRSFFQGLTGVSLPGSPGASAAKSAQGLTAKGYGPGAPKPSTRWQDKYKAIQQDAGLKQYAANVAQTWLKQEKELSKQFAPPASAATPTTTPTTNSQEPVFVGGQQLNPKDPKDAKLLMTLKSQGKLKEAVGDNYLETFKRWANQTLATRVPATGETVTMEKVLAAYPDLAEQLNQALQQVGKTVGTPAHEQAIQNYIMLAVAGVQGLAQTGKNQYGTVQTNLGIGTQQLAQLKALARTPQGLAMLKQELGL